MAEIHIDQPEEDAWEDIYDEYNDNIHPKYNLHMLTQYNQEKDIGIILIWIHKITPSLSWMFIDMLEPDMPDVIRMPFIGERHEIIRRSIALWDDYNKKEVISAFVENHIVTKDQDKPTED